MKTAGLRVQPGCLKIYRFGRAAFPRAEEFPPVLHVTVEVVRLLVPGEWVAIGFRIAGRFFPGGKCQADGLAGDFEHPDVQWTTSSDDLLPWFCVHDDHGSVPLHFSSRMSAEERRIGSL